MEGDDGHQMSLSVGQYHALLGSSASFCPMLLACREAACPFGARSAAASHKRLRVCRRGMAAVKSGLETLRDYAIVEFLANRGPGKNEISKTDDALFKRLTKLFEEAGLSCEPLDYMKSAPNFWDRQNQLNNDTKGHLKSKVKTSFAGMLTVLQLCGFNATTVEDSAPKSAHRECLQ